ncbi:DUF4870 domain-containing protein [Gryllotalpicola ginsengisoli]|uniref:DUF4870 domain-containing protein n=1 Tax=Gryllotalpicola ginsengisoli TaxID=444608 RepID=UPI0003B41648|nr:DUF4870 domain-containing protein [Gryllotalpicola ginsengisoli]
MTDASTDLPTRKGTWAWVLTLGSLICPVIAPLVFVVAGVFAYHWYNKQRDVGAVNARNAANWTITYALVSVICAVVVYLLGVFSSLAPFVLGALAFVFLGVWVVATLMTIAYGVMGIVAAVKGRAFETAFTWRPVKGAASWDG